MTPIRPKQQKIKRIAVFCGASSGTDPAMAIAAARLAELIAASGIGIVYGGGHVGLMGVVADAGLEAGGEVIGVIPGFMIEKELAHERLTELITVRDMHERKIRMHELSDAVVALPGGFGTMDELFEMLTWRQLGIHEKPIGLLNLKGFYDSLLAQAARMERDGFLHGRTRIIALTEPEELVNAILED